MLQKDQTAISHMGSAVSLTGVDKHFLQWQRDNSAKGMIRNLIKPEKGRSSAGGCLFRCRKGRIRRLCRPEWRRKKHDDEAVVRYVDSQCR